MTGTMSTHRSPSTAIVTSESYHGPAKASWIILALACIAAAVPFLGFASWLVAGPLLTITFVLGVVVITRGGTGMGICILLAALIGAPIWIFFAPILMSLLGLAGAGAAIQQADQHSTAAGVDSRVYVAPTPSSRAPNHPQGVPVVPATARAMPSASEAKNADSVPKSPVSLPQDPDFDKIRLSLQEQSPKVFKLKSLTLITEGPRGYLTSSDKLDLTQRELVQRENFNREKMFAIIARHTGKTSEEVGAVFAGMAKRFGNSSSTSQP